jgi:hypothetical protein
LFVVLGISAIVVIAIVGLARERSVGLVNPFSDAIVLAAGRTAIIGVLWAESRSKFHIRVAHGFDPLEGLGHTTLKRMFSIVKLELTDGRSFPAQFHVV